MAETISRAGSASYPQGTYSTHKKKSGTSAESGNGVYQVSNPTYLLGEKNPKWRDMIRKGLNASTPLEALDVRHTYGSNTPRLKVRWEEVPGVTTPSYAFIECTAEGYSYKTSVVSDSTVRSISISSAYNEAVSIYHQKVNNAFRNLQAGVIAGEWRETQRLIKNRGSSIFDGANGVERRIQDWIRRNRRLGSRARRLRDLVRTASDLWLEYSFGIAPLVNDVEGAIDYFNNESTAYRRKVRAIHTTSEQYGIPYWAIVGAYGAAKIKTLEKRYKTASVLLYGVVSLGGPEGLKLKKLGLHPSDWLPTLYELTPYSFLIDYFTNLNGIVAAVGNLNLRLDWTGMTTKRIYERRHSNSFPLYYDESHSAKYYHRPIVDYFVPCNGSVFKELTERDPSIEVTIPDLVFSLPDSPLQWLNMAALVGANSETRRLVSNL